MACCVFLLSRHWFSQSTLAAILLNIPRFEHLTALSSHPLSPISGRHPPGRWPSPPGRWPSPPGRWPSPPGRWPSPPGRWPSPPGRWPSPPGRWPSPPGRWPSPPGRWPSPHTHVIVGRAAEGAALALDTLPAVLLHRDHHVVGEL